MDIAIMYHYICDRKWNGIVPLTPNEFKEQIEFIATKYDIVSLDDLHKPKKLKPRCVLTFDDGTKDQYENAFAFLKQKGLPGYFTVMSGPLQKMRIPTFHLVHAILSFYSDKEIWEDINTEFVLPDIKERSNQYYSYEKNEFRRYNKYIFNFFLGEQDSRNYLLQKLLENYESEQKFIQEYYISINEWVEMSKAGMTLGVHCVDHLPYNEDPEAFYSNEIAPCVSFIEKSINIKTEWYTPAFGGGEKSKQMINELEPILKENGFKGGFTTSIGLNQGLNNFWLNRYDCMDIFPLKK
ncbi:polysaccharide deacetylase family protein [Paenibacillus luteus]|uniref:polysaccharide deacetylase family protein n=1 Tax=Paenibacillus luteus TaxID=2545753 RepID=UPI001142AB09|nr:polysaccharide deacetylase family protein [Paenibacillus luteus]